MSEQEIIAEFEHGMNLVITDMTIYLFEKNKGTKGSFSDYNAWCSYIKTNLEGGMVKNFARYIFPLVEEVNKIYCMGEEELADYVVRYFLNAVWREYQPILIKYKATFGKFLTL